MEWDTVCSVFGVQLSGHDQQHSLKSEPDLTGSREGWPDVCLCPVVKCVIRGVRGWTRGVCANSAADNCEDTRHGWELTPCLWSVLRLHKSVQLSRATLFLIEVAQSSATLTVCLLSPLSARDNDHLLSRSWTRDGWFLSLEIFSVGLRVILMHREHTELDTGV